MCLCTLCSEWRGLWWVGGCMSTHARGMRDGCPATALPHSFLPPIQTTHQHTTTTTPPHTQDAHPLLSLPHPPPGVPKQPLPDVLSLQSDRVSSPGHSTPPHTPPRVKRQAQHHNQPQPEAKQSKQQPCRTLPSAMPSPGKPTRNAASPRPARNMYVHPFHPTPPHPTTTQPTHPTHRNTGFARETQGLRATRTGLPQEDQGHQQPAAEGSLSQPR